MISSSSCLCFCVARALILSVSCLRPNKTLIIYVFFLMSPVSLSPNYLFRWGNTLILWISLAQEFCRLLRLLHLLLTLDAWRWCVVLELVRGGRIQNKYRTKGIHTRNYNKQTQTKITKWSHQAAWNSNPRRIFFSFNQTRFIFKIHCASFPHIMFTIIRILSRETNCVTLVFFLFKRNIMTSDRIIRSKTLFAIYMNHSD